MRYTALQLLAIAAVLSFVSLTHAQTRRLAPTAHPSTFCELAADLGYPSRGYKAHTGSCGSNMIEVTPTPGKNGLNNTLAFYAMGASSDPSKLMRVSLILNVNNTREKSQAQAELARVATGVATKIVGVEPPGFEAVIRQAGSKKWAAGEWTIEIKSDVWPTGLGQDTAVYFWPGKR